MKFASSKSLFLRSIQSPYRAISVLIANLSSSSSSSNIISGSTSGQFTSLRRPQHDDQSRSVRVSVWWDFENCNLPAGSNVFKVAQTLTAAVRINGIKGPITITAFGDILQLSRTNQEALSATGINLTHVPQGGKNSADRSLITDLMCWVSQNPPPAHLFLISSDRDFSSILHKLRMSNYNILLAGNEETTPSVLCSAASIMWDWNDLVKGIHLTGKHFNQPPDGPYNSWYGHYRTPLLDPFAVTISCSSSNVKIEELGESSNSNPDSGFSMPKEIVEEIGLVLSLYPKGVKITDLREDLKKRNVLLDNYLYGYKKFSKFLLSLPEILKIVPLRDGMFLVHGVATHETENKESSSLPKLSSEKNHKAVTVEKIDQKTNDNDVKEESQSEQTSQESSVLAICEKDEEDVKEESQREQSSQESSVLAISGKDEEDVKEESQPEQSSQESSVLAISEKVKEEPAKENRDGSVSGFFNKLNRLCFGSSEMETEQFQEKKQISLNGDESKVFVNEGKDLGNGESANPGILNRVLKRFEFFWGRNKTELSSEASGTGIDMEDDVFAKDSFWKDVESFINSPRGFFVVSHSRSREALAKNLKDEGSLSSLKPLDESKTLDLVSLLITEKKWIKENPSNPLPFRVTRFTENGSTTSSGLRSIFVNMSKKSQCDEEDYEKKSKDISMREGLRSRAIADCRKLVKEITEENPGGYNMSIFKREFLQRFGYKLDHYNLGYPKLQSLIETMPEARIESGYIVPSSSPAPYDPFEELGPVSKTICEFEPLEEEDSDLEMEKQSVGDERKKMKGGDETESDLLRLLSSWDDVKVVDDGDEEKPDYAVGKEKLVDGILRSLEKKPSGECRV